MTNGSDFRKYQRLKTQIEKEINETQDSQRYKKLRALYRRNFPTKEQVIEEVERFYEEEAP